MRHANKKREGAEEGKLGKRQVGGWRQGRGKCGGAGGRREGETVQEVKKVGEGLGGYW